MVIGHSATFIHPNLIEEKHTHFLIFHSRLEDATEVWKQAFHHSASSELYSAHQSPFVALPVVGLCVISSFYSLVGLPVSGTERLLRMDDLLEVERWVY